MNSLKNVSFKVDLTKVPFNAGETLYTYAERVVRDYGCEQFTIIDITPRITIERLYNNNDIVDTVCSEQYIEIVVMPSSDSKVHTKGQVVQAITTALMNHTDLPMLKCAEYCNLIVDVLQHPDKYKEEALDRYSTNKYKCTFDEGGV